MYAGTVLTRRLKRKKNLVTYIHQEKRLKQKNLHKNITGIENIRLGLETIQKATDGNASSGTFSEMYKYYYTFVFRANDAITHIDQVPDMDASEKAKLKAEAKFLRAYGYMNLNVQLPCLHGHSPASLQDICQEGPPPQRKP